MLTTPRNPFRVTLIALLGASLLLFAAFRFRTTSTSSKPLHRSSASTIRLASLPPVILWAWERPEKLDYLDPEETAVAFLAKTIYLRADEIVSRPRLQPLAVPTGAAVIAVARIESEHAESPTLSTRQVKETAAEIAKLGSLPNVVMVQVDFDATTSQRFFYRSLLNELRAKLPQSTLLSITALASWCKGDNWLDDLPIDEAVPMLFRMGVEEKQFLSQLAVGSGFSARPCQASAGISTDEPLAQLPPGQRIQRVYVFNPKSWSPEAVNQIMETYQK